MAYLKQVNASDGRVRVDSTTGKTILAGPTDPCCCTDIIDKPGNCIYARKCCSGEVTNIYLKLDALPTVPYFLSDWHAIDDDPDYCFFFSAADIGSSILTTEVEPTDVDFLANEEDYEEVDCSDALCGCKCCNDWRDDPLDPNVGTRGGRTDVPGGVGSVGWDGNPIWYQFYGVQACPRIFTCYNYETAFGEPRSLQVQPFTMPSGPYTGAFDGGSEVDYGCPEGLIPNITYDIKYYNAHGCSASYSHTDTLRLPVMPGQIGPIGINIPPDPSCTAAHPSFLFWGADPVTFETEWSDCNTGATWNNALVGCDCGDNSTEMGYGAGYGGTCVVGPCCPDGGGI